MESINLFFIHGFLGQPSDWDVVSQSLKNKIPSAKIHMIDLWKDERFQPKSEFPNWAHQFCQFAENFPGKRIIIGYSLGGRLALHALKMVPRLWDQVICLSTNPGFDDRWRQTDHMVEEREKRWIADSEWAHLFAQGPWDQVVKSWNAQSVFNGSKLEPQRLQKDFDRNMLGLALTTWSHAVQENLRPVLREQFHKISWILGALDEKYCQMTDEVCKTVPALKVIKVPEAGHRVFIDQPELLTEILAKEIRSVI